MTTKINKRRDYCGNFEYIDGKLLKIHIPGGYLDVLGNDNYSLNYTLKDYKGNNCVTLSESGEAIQENHYYPFGMLMGSSTNEEVHRNKYGDKELERMHGLYTFKFLHEITTM